MKFYLRHIRLNKNGCAPGKHGKYWGSGLPIYEYESVDGSMHYTLRAHNRSEAKEIIGFLNYGATFFN